MTNPNLQKLFCETFKLNPTRWELDCYNGPFFYDSFEKAEGSQRLLMGVVVPCYPTLDLDLLFDVAKREKCPFYIELWESVSWKVVIFGDDPIIVHADNPTESLLLALLRFRGINVEEK